MRKYPKHPANHGNDTDAYDDMEHACVGRFLGRFIHIFLLIFNTVAMMGKAKARVPSYPTAKAL